MKFCEGKVVELDPNKWYWLVVDPYAEIDFTNITVENGQIILARPEEIEFVENPERIKGIIVKEF